MKKIVLSAALSVFAMSFAQAKSGVVSISNNDVNAQADASAYWTPARLKSAKALAPVASPNAAKSSAVDAQAATGTPQSSNAGLATANVAPKAVKLFEPGVAAALDGVAPQDEGTFNAPYSTSKVNSPISNNAQYYPWRTVGKLYFTQNGGNYQCSASVIARRVIVTAGHCVHSGNGAASGWSSNFNFIPAFENGAAPYKQWSWSLATTTTDWYSGGGGVPNAADYAMIVLRDQPFVTGGPNLKIGEVVGWLGWQTLSLARNHTTKLGYPCNFGNCQSMIQTTSDNFRNTSPNNVEYGSDQRGGSSGGPWVQNFNVQAPNEGGKLNPNGNRVVGVTSYGYVSFDPRVQGASIPDNRWVGLWNTVCAGAGNC